MCTFTSLLYGGKGYQTHRVTRRKPFIIPKYKICSVDGFCSRRMNLLCLLLISESSELKKSGKGMTTASDEGDQRRTNKWMGSE